MLLYWFICSLIPAVIVAVNASFDGMSVCLGVCCGCFVCELFEKITDFVTQVQDPGAGASG